MLGSVRLGKFEDGDDRGWLAGGWSLGVSSGRGGSAPYEIMAANGDTNGNGEHTQSPARGEEALRKMVLVSVLVCGFYIFVSSMMVFSNKAMSYTYQFNSMNVLLLAQMLFTTMLLLVLRSLGSIQFESFQVERAIKVAPVSIFYSLNAAVALMALREMSVPSYTLVKRLAPLFTITLEYFLLNKTSTFGVVASILCMMVGTLVAFSDDTSSTLQGWILGFTSCLLQALYLSYVKRTGLQQKLNTFAVLYYHSILSVPCFLVLIFFSGEYRDVLKFNRWQELDFIAVFTASLMAGFLLNYALFLCTEKTSPTTLVVSGHVKAVLQTVLGFFTFGGVDTTHGYMLGTLLNISGGFGYVYAKYRALQSQTVSATLHQGR